MRVRKEVNQIFLKLCDIKEEWYQEAHETVFKFI